MKRVIGVKWWHDERIERLCKLLTFSKKKNYHPYQRFYPSLFTSLISWLLMPIYCTDFLLLETIFCLLFGISLLFLFFFFSFFSFLLVMDCTKLPSLVYFFIQLFPFCSFYFLFFLVFWFCNFSCQYFMSATLLSVHLVAYLKMPKNNGVRTLGEQQVSTTTLRSSRCP